MFRLIGLIFTVLFLLALTACQKSEPTDTAASAQTPAPARVDAGRLLAIDAEPGAWLTGGRDFGSSHYSPLSAITRENLNTLGLAWDFATGTEDRKSVV